MSKLFVNIGHVKACDPQLRLCSDCSYVRTVVDRTRESDSFVQVARRRNKTSSGDPGDQGLYCQGPLLRVITGVPGLFRAVSSSWFTSSPGMEAALSCSQTNSGSLAATYGDNQAQICNQPNIVTWIRKDPSELKNLVTVSVRTTSNKTYNFNRRSPGRFYRHSTRTKLTIVTLNHLNGALKKTIHF